MVQQAVTTAVGSLREFLSPSWGRDSIVGASNTSGSRTDDLHSHWLLNGGDSEVGGLSQRKFGVEIECGNHAYGYDTISRELKKEKIPFLSAGYDGSGIEIRTKPLKGVEGLKTLKNIMVFLADKGCYVSSADGMHVHHDAPEFVYDGKKVVQLVESWYANRGNFYAFVEQRRRNRRGPWVKDSVDRIKEQQKQRNNDVPYYGRNELNISSLREHGTIEVRLHEGTLNFDEAEAWIRLCQTFISDVAKKDKPLPKFHTCQAMLEGLNISDSVQERLLAIAERKTKEHKVEVRDTTDPGY